MLGRRKGLTSILAVSLSLLVVSPQFMVALLTTHMQTATPALISVKSKNCVKVLTEFGQNVTLQQFVTTETWTNGTRVCISDHNTNSPYDVCVNCTTWLDPNVTSTSTVESLPAMADAHPLATESGLYSQTEYDNGSDGVLFLLKGSNGTCFVTYDHDDNYDSRGYHACQWDADYSLQGTQDLHTHLPASLVSDWIVGNLTAVANMIEMSILGSLTDDIFGDIACILGCPIPAAGLIILDIVDTIQTIIAMWNNLQVANWVQSVVEELFAGDGWTWRGPISTYDDAYGVCLPAPITGSYGPPELFMYKCVKLVDWYDISTWHQSWGSEGIFSNQGQDYVVSWFDHMDVQYPTNIVGQ